MEEAILRLFKAYLGEKTEDINEEALKYGILIPSSADMIIVDEAIKLYGKDGKKWNETFHKNLSTIKESSNEELVIQQIIHYITTYGFENLGIYSKEKVYIPKEELDIPELDVDKIELVVISPITEKELALRIMNLITSGIALSNQTLEDIMILSKYIDKNKIDEVKNRELKVYLYDKYDIVPNNPDEFLRYLIYKLTGSTLKIQNYYLYKQMKNSDKKCACKLLEKYLVNEEAYNRLSSIFLRNKKLFFALKISESNNSEYEKEVKAKINKYINKLRKLADKNHKPMKKDVLDMLTQDIEIENEAIISALDRITIFREIRILNGIAYRMNGKDDIVYKIRNGSSYATKLKPKTNDYINILKDRYGIVKEHLLARVSKRVKDKKVYLPENVSYTVPTSEKQFNGNYPEGSYIEVPRDSNLVYGIHWNNLEKTSFNKYLDDCIDIYGFKNQTRVDLDIKQMNRNEVFGWDKSYKSDSGDILFSGDVTDAPLPNGATELFYVSKKYGNNAFLITVNNFTRNGIDVPFEFVIAKAEENAEFNNEKNYIIDPNKIIEKINLVVPKDNSQIIVGLITIADNIRLYLNDFGQGNNNTSNNDEVTMTSFEYLQSYSKIQLKFDELLRGAGAVFTDSPDEVDYDLSINSITKDTLITMLSDNN